MTEPTNIGRARAKRFSKNQLIDHIEEVERRLSILEQVVLALVEEPGAIHINTDRLRPVSETDHFVILQEEDDVVVVHKGEKKGNGG